MGGSSWGVEAAVGRQGMGGEQAHIGQPPACSHVQGLPEGGMRRIILTASGGAFRDWPVEKLKEVGEGCHGDKTQHTPVGC